MEQPAFAESQREVEALRAKLADAEEMLRAIRHGEVDSLLIQGGDGERVYTLRSADAPYRALVEQMQEGAVTVNLDGDVIYANQSFADFVAMPLERVIGSPIDTFIDDHDHAALWACVRGGRGALRTRLRGAGRTIEVHLSVNQITPDDTAHRTLIVTDLTTLAQVQRESQSKDEFLAMLAHELRNPLAPIRTGLQVLRLAPDEATATRVRDMMDRQVTQMVRLIDDLLDVSRVSSGKIELKRDRVDVQSVIALAVETSLPAIESGHHHFTLRLPPDALLVDADPVRLAQVFSNLLNNAAKYTPDGGRLELTATREGGMVRVEVSDTGVGIAADTVHHVFEMFSQVGRNRNRSTGGLGIGLTLVRRLTEMHGGSVEAASPGPGQGSVFTVRVPLVPEAAAGHAAVAPGVTVPASPQRRLRVLVVDDNLDGAHSLGMLVAMHGHDTALAHDGPTGLAQIDSFGPDLVLCDIGLPGIDGYEVARHVRAAEAQRGGRPVTLVSLTGWGSADDRRQARLAGFDQHLTKPVAPADLEALLERIGQTSPQ